MEARGVSDAEVHLNLLHDAVGKLRAVGNSFLADFVVDAVYFVYPGEPDTQVKKKLPPFTFENGRKFLCCLLVRIYDIFRNKRRVFYGIVMLFVCVGYISSPYAVIDHASESTIYEMAFMAGLMLGIIFSSSRRPSCSGAVMAAMFACMLLSSAHKLYVMHDYTLGVHNFLEEHAGDFRNTPDKVYVYYIADVPLEGFSVYKAPLGYGLSQGLAFNSLWGWKADMRLEEVKSEADIDFTPDSLPEYDTVFSLTQSGILKILRN